MDKKIMKKILIVFLIILLIGIGIWGYKKIKNRNNDSKVVENENDIKAIDSLINIGTNRDVKNGSITYRFVYKMYLKEKGIKTITCNKKETNAKVYDIIFNLYVSPTTALTDQKKIMSSWIVRDFTDCNAVNAKNANITALVNATNAPIAQVSGNYFLVGFKSNSFIYTKIFDVTTGELIFDVPTNNLETFTKFAITTTNTNTIKFTGNNTNTLKVAISKNSAPFSTNKYAIFNNSLYYLDTDYKAEIPSNSNIPSSYVKLNVHKVDFADGKYTDTNLSDLSDVDLVYAEVKLNGEK